MKKHTPGPWEIKIHDEGSYFTEVEVWHQNYGRLAIMQDNTSIWNSEKKEDVAKEALDQTIANANLMVAAPIMFDALRAVKNTLLDAMKIDSTRNVHSPVALLDLVQNAIKKATP